MVSRAQSSIKILKIVFYDRIDTKTKITQAGLKIETLSPTLKVYFPSNFKEKKHFHRVLQASQALSSALTVPNTEPSLTRSLRCDPEERKLGRALEKRAKLSLLNKIRVGAATVPTAAGD